MYDTGRIVKEQGQAGAASLNATTNEHMASGDAWSSNITVNTVHRSVSFKCRSQLLYVIDVLSL